MSEKPHVVDNNIIHLPHQFHANPANGFETIGFRKIDYQLTYLIQAKKMTEKLLFSP